ncbi:MAG: HpcH/HpaI aldolase/citrate lyase family protein, partial [Saprospiraceae bacterium]
IQSYEVPAIVRIPAVDPVMIKQLLDAGAQNILIPMIETADQAELVAKAMVYPPAGIRGVGTALARAAQWNRVNDYFKLANDEMCCIGQIESIKAVENLDEILTVDGLDVCFLGPADLGATMGYLGQPSHPEVVKLVKECIRKIVKSGKAAGFLTGSKELIQVYSDAGATMCGVGLDSLILAKGTKSLAESYKSELKHNQSNTQY